MSDQRNLLVGYDFADDYTQISCYNTKIYEPESVSPLKAEQYLIPTVLSVKEGNKEWLYGEEAIAANLSGEARIVRNLVKIAAGQESVELYETSFAPEVLLEKYFRKTLGILKMKYPGESIAQLVVTVDETSEMLNRCIYSALANLGIDKDRVVVKSHAVAAMYYTLNQNKDLWMNDVGVFHYDGLRLCFYRIAVNRRTKPSAVTVTKEDFTESFGELYTSEATSTDEHKSQLAYLFHRIAKTCLSKYVISTVFVTGKGFEEEWIDGTLQELCLGRRIFKGQNLYTKGACYMARELKGEKKLEDYILLSEEMLHSNVWFSAYVDARVQEVMLAKIGTPWYEVNEQIEFIFDGKPEVTLHAKSLFERETSTYKMILDNIPNRPNKMTRAKLTLQCKNRDYIEATLQDLGFGELYPKTDIICSTLIPLV